MHAWQIRGLANWVNLATPLGIGIAWAGRARMERGPRDLRVASGYRLPFPVAGAFTVGSVVISARPAGALVADPVLLGHEERHATQWAVCGGLPFLPAYLAAMAWSQWRVGDPGSANVFERLAGLASGGYTRPDPTAVAALRARRRARLRGWRAVAARGSVR